MLEKDKNFISAVVYVRNCEERIEGFLKMLISILNNSFEHSEIICVNDCSDDQSLDKIRKVSNQSGASCISVINMSYYHGLEMAMNAGDDLAIGDFIFEFDNTNVDFAPEEIMKAYRKSLDGYDIVSASPDKKEKLSSAVFYKVFSSFSGNGKDMNTESFRVVSRRAINRVHSMSKTIPYRKVAYLNCGLRTDNILYKQTVPDHRADDKDRGYRFNLAVETLILFTDIGYKFSLAMTLFMMAVSIFVVIYSFIIYFTAHPVAGWTTTILFLAIAFFGLFGVLTIVIKYLQLLIDLTFKRKHYSFESIEKLTN